MSDFLSALRKLWDNEQDKAAWNDYLEKAEKEVEVIRKIREGEEDEGL